MAKPLNELPNHDRFGFIPYREPVSVILGQCSCGCRDQIEVGYEYIEWDDRYFVDRSHVIDYLKKYDGLREV